LNQRPPACEADALPLSYAPASRFFHKPVVVPPLKERKAVRLLEMASMRLWMVLALLFLCPSRSTATTLGPPPVSQYRVVTVFGSSTSDGWQPLGGLMRAQDGTLWGTTQLGGNQGGPLCFISCGTVYRLIPSGLGFVRQNVYAFSGPDGANPLGQLVQVAGGTIYGTTARGGTGGTGVIFAINPATLSFNLVYSFPTSSLPQTGGVNPYSGLIARGNTLYGTTSGGGNSTFVGTIYALNALTGVVSILHWFNPVSAANPAGEGSESSLLLASDGLLYGTATYGGATGYGEIFRLAPDGSNYTVLHTFTGADGNQPRGPLVEFYGGIFGVTSGGAGTGGTVYRIAQSGLGFKPLWTFSTEVNPVSLVPAYGYLFGTTFMGGTAGEGSIFRLSRAGTLTLVHSFAGGPADGQAPPPEGALLDIGNGRLIGATAGGGPNAPPYSNFFYIFFCGATACFGDSVTGGGTAYELDVTSAGAPLKPDRQPLRR